METHPLDSAAGFRAVSWAWLRAGWDAKYVYGFTWLGRPLIQLPEDALRLQELIVEIRPDVVLETGVAHGGSAVLSASVCRALGHGRVIAVEVDLRPHNRAALDEHPLRPLITLIDGDSTAPETVRAVHELIAPGERVMVILDANHTRDHVLRELEAYASLVPVGSYVVAMDGVMAFLDGAPRTEASWADDNPRQAVAEFVADHPEWEVVEPPFPFNEGTVRDRVTYAPGGIIRRRPA